MKLVLEFEIKGLPKTINQIGRKHWAVKTKHAKLWKHLVIEQCVLNYAAGLKLEKAELEFTRFGSRECDFDNLVGSFKHVMDGLVIAEVIVNDTPTVVGSPKFLFEKVKMKETKIRVRVFQPD